MKNMRKMKESLCWRCQHSSPKKGENICPWCEHCEPVYGWDVIKHGKSYFVNSCPLFLEETPETAKISLSSDNNAVITLIERVLSDLAECYISALKNRDTDLIRSYERDIKSKGFEILTGGMVDPLTYIKNMRSKYFYKREVTK